MRIAVTSDFHLGSKSDSVREDDPFVQSRKAIEKALEKNADLIIILGDIFDSRNPDQEVWSEALKTLSLTTQKENQGLELDRFIDEDERKISDLPLRGVPVLAIHGNHERRGKGFVDIIEALESSGLLMKLHHSGVVFDSPEGKIAIQGMGHVPEKYARTFLEEWGPEPVEDAFNIFLMHQGLGRYTFSSSDSAELEPGDLIKDFDLYLSGHVHYKVEDEVFEKPLLFPGSTFRTQLLSVEAEIPKGLYLIDIDSNGFDFEFVEFDFVRDFFYEEFEFQKASVSGVEDEIARWLRELSSDLDENKDRKPIVRARLIGTLEKGSSTGELDFKRLKGEYDNLILNFTTTDLKSIDLEEQTKFLQDVRKENISMEERGLKVLDANLEELGYDADFDSHDFFDFLSNNEIEKAFDAVISNVEKKMSGGETD